MRKSRMRSRDKKAVVEAIVGLGLVAFIAGGSTVVGVRTSLQETGRRIALLWAPDDEARDLTAVIVMQPDDCASMTQQMDQLSSLLGMAGVPVQGVLATNRSNDVLADSLIDSDAVSFSLRKARSTDLAVGLRAFGIDATPVLVLADRRGRVRYLAAFEPNQRALEAEIGRILGIVRGLRSEQ